jgi:UDP-N-acetylmuramoylalanine--D-glutamate ligase
MFEQSKKYAILGLARSGIAAAIKIKSMGGKAFLSDLKQESEIPESQQLKADFECEFGQHSDKLLECDEWIVSPGIPLSAPIIVAGRQQNMRMISELEFGFQIKSPDSKVIAVTGSNGKSTTASLIGHIISQSGSNCILAGNIGDALCGFPIEQPGTDFIVLEVSSFQLDLIDTFQPDIALVLNITPDHLNRYASFEDYALSKLNIFRNQIAANHAILNLDDSVIRRLEDKIHSTRHYFSLSDQSGQIRKPDTWMEGRTIKYDQGQEEFHVKNMQIQGPHNWANAMAAILACEIAGIPNVMIKSGLQSFISLKHRLQYVNTINGIVFFNDSKATNTDSVKYALLSFEQPIRIIMGGSDKGEDFGVLTDLLREHATKVYVTGATTEKMLKAWSGEIPVTAIGEFESCVRTAFAEASVGDIIVLSPACASYDKFRNFEHRGETFVNIVNNMAAEHEKTR